MSRLWRRVQRQPALFAGAVLVILNLVLLSGEIQLSTQAVGGINAVVAALLAFLVNVIGSGQLRSVHRRYVLRARDTPQAVVQSAGSMIDEVVGRDELCRVIMEDLRDPDSRRAHVVVGGVGTGKTALLVRLTKLLAERGVVPVPVRLRDAEQKLDFRELARERFLEDTDASLMSSADGERVWRQLCQDDKIVVLADGLEETLIEGDIETERDNLIRVAIDRANESRLPLVIASRPHDPLRGMAAAIVELEPLSEDAALEYVQGTDPSVDEHRLDWIMKTAGIAESPLYLPITRQLHRMGFIEYGASGRDGGQLDTRSVDRAELRLRLLEAWTQALISGYFPAGLPLSREDRQVTVEQLSALACIGLREDRLVVRFDDLESRRLDRRTTMGNKSRTIIDVAQGQSWRRPDPRWTATWGMQLGLVEASGGGVRFPHSIMQAYLGSRLMDVAMADPQYRDEALRNPGQELLIAMVMYSRSMVRDIHPDGPAQTRIGGTGPGDEGRSLQSLLLEAASYRADVKALDLYAAALEIDSIDAAPAHDAIADQLQTRWLELWARDPWLLEEAKLNVVRRFGEAARTIAERCRKEPDCLAEPAYRRLYCIGCSEPSFPIRLAAAQEIGAGGAEAFAALHDVLGPRDPPDLSDSRAVLGAGELGDRRVGHEPLPHRDLPDEGEREEHGAEKLIRAWLAPLLVGSVTGLAREPRQNLERWIQFIARTDREPGVADARLLLEIALAQGFKYAANRRRRHPHADPEAGTYLAKQARELLKGVRFWFSRLTLVHALCLWSLPDGPSERKLARSVAELEALVEYWIAVPDGRPEHPFVVEASRLAVLTLETGQPERFLWIDESATLARVGSRPANPDVRRKHDLWIPPSTGWTALHPRAQQLLADVQLLLNLADRGQRRSDRAQLLQRTDRNALPPCLVEERSPLDPTRTVGMAVTSEPGSSCRTGCPFELCPYPPKGEHTLELSEAFCRRQQALVGEGWARRRAAPWQKATSRDLRRFWRQMDQRARL